MQEDGTYTSWTAQDDLVEVDGEPVEPGCQSVLVVGVGTLAVLWRWLATRRRGR